MHILFIINGFFRSGAENYVFKLAPKIKKNKHITQISIIAVNRPNNTIEVKKIKKLLGNKKINLFEINRPPKRGLMKIMTKIIKISQQIAPDIIHVHGDWMPNLVGLIFFLYARIRHIYPKAVITHHSQSIVQKKWFIKLLSTITDKIYTKHLFLYEKQIYKYKFKPDDSHVEITTNFVDNLFFNTKLKKDSNNSSNINIINIARFATVKNPYFFIKLIQYIKKKCPSYLKQLKIIMIGTGSLKKQFISALKSKNLSQYFILYKTLPPKKIINQLDRADVFILPSKSEAFPTVVLESFARGVPVITSQFDIFKTSKIKSCGYFLKNFSPKRVTNCLTQLINKPKKYQRISNNCLQISSRFKPDKIINKHISIYKDLMNQNK